MNLIRRLSPSPAAGDTATALRIEPASRTVVVIASDESVDRYSDIVRVSGWQLDAFRANPVLLWAHDAGETPVGKVVSISVIGTKLIARAVFLPPGATRAADECWNAVAAGALRALSVGFVPTAQPNPIRDSSERVTGFEYVGQELLELSFVSVPALRSAVVISNSAAMPRKAMPPSVAASLALASRRLDALRTL